MTSPHILQDLEASLAPPHVVARWQRPPAAGSRRGSISSASDNGRLAGPSEPDVRIETQRAIIKAWEVRTRVHSLLLTGVENPLSIFDRCED